MDIPQIGTPLGTLMIICCLWVWTIRKGKAHLFQQEVILREQNKSATWAFAVCLTAMGITFTFAIPAWLVSFVSFLTFISFAIASNRDHEGFWRKRRNILVGSTMSLLGFSLAPYVFTKLYFVPVLCSLLIAHLAHRRFLSIFSSNLRDLEALQSKLLKHEAERRNYSLLATEGSDDRSFREPIETTA
ncbi:hypothetical protein [Pseudobacteriovorax antillogorgiicola]|uniref:Uncharacterized protein n=1 Tax=Pseudobacteriovorax antillogorgiicola TaxID=1513793 RepID=A0A1Y6BWZ7_9BACT|nr:hypothetical protein [Pseudobacteriovorax antillogorgiicola]TCS53774.1 hypothetical protein EDD56_10783 [Pseudobacteriovorax antillogorgiicola]SMF22421.1 hypothetical protein SAMN06296036_107189 [Pseudobacteriovorax antillogorgiicola]